MPQPTNQVLLKFLTSRQTSKSESMLNTIKDPSVLRCMAPSNKTSSHSLSSIVSLEEPHVTTPPGIAPAKPSIHGTELLCVNVSGQRFLFKISRLAGNPRIAEVFYRHALWYEDGGEYYLERDPTLFSIIHQYLLHGQLHLPRHLCPQLILNELQFWGFQLEELEEHCCHVAFKSSLNERDTLQALQQWLMKRPDGCVKNLLQTQQWFSNVRQRAWEILTEPISGCAGRLYFVLSLSLTILSIILYWMSAVKRTSSGDTPAPENTTDSNSPNYLEISLEVCTWCFMFECICRFLFCPFLYPYFLNLATAVDFLLFFAIQLQRFPVITHHPKGRVVLDLMRICYILRSIRFLQIFPETRVLIFTIKRNLRKLFVICAYLLVTALIFGAIVFITDDHDITSLEDALWWSVITMTTVGYGDKVPKTNGGRIVGIFCAFVGIGIVGLVIPIFSNNFFRNYNNSRLLKAIPSLTNPGRNERMDCGIQKPNSSMSLSATE